MKEDLISSRMEKVSYQKHIKKQKLNHWVSIINDVIPDMSHVSQILVQKCEAFVVDEKSVLLFERIKEENGYSYAVIHIMAT